MVAIGQFNQLTVIRQTEAGVYLDAANYGQILLPHSDRALATGKTCDPDTQLDVFIYRDSDDRLAATTESPLACVGQFAWLTVVAVTEVGAFLDWGLPKDLLLPYSEQKYEPEVGKRVMVRVYLDNSDRLAASTRLDNFLSEQASGFKPGQQVQLFIAETTELGYKAIVDNSHWGVLYNNELFRPVSKGQQLTGYIRKIRPDKKIDLSLSKPGREQLEQVSEQIVNTLSQHGGYMMITDKTPPQTIYSVFNVSKKVYKKAVGILYKQRRIDIEQHGIRLLDVD